MHRKSWCYIIDFKWTGNKWEYRNKDDVHGDYYLFDKNKRKEVLKQLDVSEASETLGVHLSPDGNDRVQRKKLREKCEIFGDQVRTSDCEPNTAIYLFNSCLMASIRYCLPVTNFSEKDWDYILAPAKKRVLQKAEMASNFPNEALYGSQSYDGYLFQHPYTNQGIEKIATLIQETVDNTQTGSLISATAEGFRLELGINTEMAEIKWDTVNVCITDSWYKGIVDFVHKSKKRHLPKNKRNREEISRTK